MILLYRVLTFVIYPLLLILVYFRKIAKKEDPDRFKEKIFPSHFKIKRGVSSKLVWFHAASIGEFKSIVPVMKNLLMSNKNLEILLTTTTVSSGTLARIELKKFENVHHRYFPFDVEFLMKGFIEVWRPNYIFLVDSEIWPNLIILAKKKKIPLALINARLTSKSFKRWIMFPETAKKIFNSFDLCLVSNNETKKYLEKLNARNIFFKGNLKLTNEIVKDKINNINEKFFMAKRFWIAASVHRGEEIFCLKTHKIIKEKYKDLVTFIVPRHIHNSKNIAVASKRLNLKTQILNKEETIFDDREIVVVNSFGVLQNYFKYAKSVFIGKSVLKKFKDKGGQNPIDAAKLGCKIYHGPYVYNFKEIYDILNKRNIAKKIETCEDLSENLIHDLSIPQKSETNISDSLESLGRKTLQETMLSINNFIK